VIEIKKKYTNTSDKETTNKPNLISYYTSKEKYLQYCKDYAVGKNKKNQNYFVKELLFNTIIVFYLLYISPHSKSFKISYYIQSAKVSSFSLLYRLVKFH